jgi:hypothetical protein
MNMQKGSGSDGEKMGLHSGVRYRSTLVLVKFISLGLALDVVLIVVVMVPQMELILAVPSLPTDSIEKMVTEYASRYGHLALFHMVVYLVLIFLFSIWVHRANLNARALGGKDMRFSPGWAVGWFFVPVMNFFRPFQVLREIWIASDIAQKQNDKNISALLITWWVLCLGTPFYGFHWESHWPPPTRTLLFLFIVKTLATVGRAMFGLLVIRTIHGLQERKWELVKSNMSQ